MYDFQAPIEAFARQIDKLLIEATIARSKCPRKWTKHVM